MPDALDWVDKATKLALEARNSDFHDDFGFSFTEGIDQNRLLRFMSMFPKLEWLFLIVLPSPDDMETVIIDEADDFDVDDFDDEEHEGKGDKDATPGMAAAVLAPLAAIGFETHFSDMAVWKDSLQAALRRHGDESRMLRSVQVEVMLHFKEVAEPPRDL
ncbi:hypothetical protein H634G_11065 [Metarhizium anisopliae BRIP 53293]|uniref:Uncharacterized protein n=1 Tax=Metarhizium anisopliae BRIP 53293 TaxID=1291518 RepID=A0A0D9NI61_METAN|nr:hypothetical protein H634G_11065 [Metarhizium anisopliae BRIP 53293]KJK85936.1 hypothetical protein H633G_10211 [Metarhizium anisopliae BRIP 53284]